MLRLLPLALWAYHSWMKLRDKLRGAFTRAQLKDHTTAGTLTGRG